MTRQTPADIASLQPTTAVRPPDDRSPWRAGRVQSRSAGRRRQLCRRLTAADQREHAGSGGQTETGREDSQSTTSSV